MTDRTALPSRLCRWLVAIFGAAYLFALALYLIGTFGLFGQVRDPLAGVFLVPLGLPWNLAIDLLPEVTWPWLAAAAPIVYLGLLASLCRWLRNRRHSPG
jgi:hypothetical protein